MVRPPSKITPTVLQATADILRTVGRYEGLMSPAPQPRLRRRNAIRTIQGSLAIEGNTLSEQQVTAVLDGKTVVGPPRDIREVENAIVTYRDVARWDPRDEEDFLSAHGALMKGLVTEAGTYRRGSVGIMKGQDVAHVAPGAAQLPRLMADLFAYVADPGGTHPLVASCVVHYEIEFIHPFVDGNGRMGRLWQHVILSRYHPVFEYVPMESVVRDRQQEYYDVLGACDAAGESTRFVEFSLVALDAALNVFMSELRPEPMTTEDRIEFARKHFGDSLFSRKDYLGLFKTLSTATASRDLATASAAGSLDVFGARAQTRYRYRVFP